MKGKIFFLVCHIICAICCAICASMTLSNTYEALFVVGAMIWSVAVGIDVTNLFYKDKD